MPACSLQALIFDVDGTLADTEDAHRAAFNQAFAACGLDWHWSRARYTELLAVAGGKERIAHHWRQAQPDLRDLGAGRAETIERLHALKNAAYAQAVHEGHVRLRPGVPGLIEAARRAGLRLAIATTTSPANVAALLRRTLGAGWREHFMAVEDAATAPRKKPDPQAYQQALRRLGVPASSALAFEDSSNGLKAARAAALATLVTPTGYTAHHDFTGALRTLDSLEGVTLDELRAWHAGAAPSWPEAA